MPLYEFQCKGCGHEFEDLVLGSSCPVCPSCNGQRLERLLSVFAVNGTADDPMPARAPAEAAATPGGRGRARWIRGWAAGGWIPAFAGMTDKMGSEGLRAADAFRPDSRPRFRGNDGGGSEGVTFPKNWGKQ